MSFFKKTKQQIKKEASIEKIEASLNKEIKEVKKEFKKSNTKFRDINTQLKELIYALKENTRSKNFALYELKKIEDEIVERIEKINNSFILGKEEKVICLIAKGILLNKKNLEKLNKITNLNAKLVNGLLILDNFYYATISKNKILKNEFESSEDKSKFIKNEFEKARKVLTETSKCKNFLFPPVVNDMKYILLENKKYFSLLINEEDYKNIKYYFPSFKFVDWQLENKEKIISNNYFY